MTKKAYCYRDLRGMNRLLVDHTRVSHRFYQTRSDNDSHRINAAADQHDQLIAAIASHNAPLAVEITLEHWALSRHRIEQYVWPDPLPVIPAGYAQPRRLPPEPLARIGAHARLSWGEWRAGKEL